MQATNLRNQGGSIPSAVTLPRPLPGTGDAYSTANRPYANKRQLVSRKVIPQATYDKIADRVFAAAAESPARTSASLVAGGGSSVLLVWFSLANPNTPSSPACAGRPRWRSQQRAGVPARSDHPRPEPVVATPSDGTGTADSNSASHRTVVGTDSAALLRATGPVSQWPERRPVRAVSSSFSGL